MLPSLIPALHRAAIGDEVLRLRVERRALAAFAESEVFATRARTGLRQGRAAQAVVATVGEIGSLLETRGVFSVGPDVDELPDAPSVREE